MSGWSIIVGMSGPIMFGIGNHKLLREGVSAQAVVVSSHLRSQDHDRLGTWHLELAIPLPDGSTGSASCKVSEGDMFAPSPGDLVPVRYAADNPTKVAVDVPALEARKAARKQAAAQADVVRVQKAIDLVREHPRDTPTG
jgi:hypothetical protein